jgi:hypothetical protein
MLQAGSAQRRRRSADGSASRSISDWATAASVMAAPPDDDRFAQARFDNSAMHAVGDAVAS